MASMPQPTPRLDDDALIGRILEQVPEAGDARRVRSLLAAWWRYAGVRNAAGAVVDSETFVAERGALGLLELPPAVAKRVIELEFALLHDPAKAAAAPAASAPAPAAPPEPPAPTAEPSPPLRVVPPPPARARKAVPAPPARAKAPGRPARQAPVPPAQKPAKPAKSYDVELGAPRARAPETVPATAFEAFQEVRERTREEAQTAIMAGILVFFSIVVGLALILGQRVDHLSLPTGADEPLVAGWRAFLAICSGFGGFAVGVVAATRMGRRRAAVVPPTVGLLGLGVLGLGLLSGSVIIAAAGAVVFALGGAVALLRR